MDRVYNILEIKLGSCELEDILTTAFLQATDPNLLGRLLRAQSLRASTRSSHVLAHLLSCRKETKFLRSANMEDDNIVS